MDDLPQLVVPHPLNDLTPEQVHDLARAAYPVVIEQLTGMGKQALDTQVTYLHPATGTAQT
jgi:hypothetical protein